MVNSQRQITAVFSALSDPRRRRILVHLSHSGEDAVTALAKPFRVSLPAISRHLRVLEKAKLIERRRSGRIHLIRFKRAGLHQAEEWLGHLAAGLDFSFDRLEDLISKEQKAIKKGKTNEVRRKHSR